MPKTLRQKKKKGSSADTDGSSITIGKIEIGGDVSGNIIIGSGNQIKSSLLNNQEKSYTEILNAAEYALLNGEYKEAWNILNPVPDQASEAGKANLLRALAKTEKNSFNSLSFGQRAEIEKLLLFARKKMGDNALTPLIILAVLEIDYYNNHGQCSKNDVDIDDVSQKISNTPPDSKDIDLINKTILISQASKNKLGLKI